MVVGDGVAIGPDADGGSGGVAVGFELFFSVLEFGFLEFDDEVDGGGVVAIGDGDVGSFFFATEADGVFKLDAVEGIAEIFVKDAEVELADGFLGGELDVFFAGNAADVGGFFSSDFFEEDGFFEGGNLRIGELGEFVVGVVEEIGEGEGGG